MSTILAQQLTSYVHALDSLSRNPSIWSEAIQKTFHKQVLSHELLEQLVQESLTLSVETHQEYLLFCQRVFSVVLLYRYSHYPLSVIKEVLDPLYVKLLKNQCPKGFQLLSIYKEWIAFLLGERVTPVGIYLNAQGIALVEYEGCDEQSHLPHWSKSAELALLGGLFALVSHDPELLKKSIAISVWLAQFIEEGRGCPEGLWMREGEFCREELSLLHALLFQFSSLMTPHERIAEAHQLMSKVFAELPIQNLGTLYPLLYLLMLEVTQRHELLPVTYEQDMLAITKKSTKYLGYTTYRYQDFSCYCSASGVGSGFAGFSKGSARIVSVGPHLGALGEMHQYGIYRTPLMQQTPFKDVLVEQREGFCSFAGWTGIVAGDVASLKPGSSWLRIEMQIKDKRALLKTEWVNFKEQPELYLVFFVKGEKAIVDKNCHLHPSTLDRYQGKASEISFQEGRSLLSIKTPIPYPMQVIPLAGDAHFWGAQFLVAYAFPQNETILFEIV